MTGGSFESLIDPLQDHRSSQHQTPGAGGLSDRARCLQPQRSLLSANHSLHFSKGVSDDPLPCTQRCQQALQDGGLLSIAPSTFEAVTAAARATRAKSLLLRAGRMEREDAAAAICLPIGRWGQANERREDDRLHAAGRGFLVRVRQAADAERVTEVSKVRTLECGSPVSGRRQEREAFPMHDRHGNSALRGGEIEDLFDRPDFPASDALPSPQPSRRFGIDFFSRPEMVAAYAITRDDHGTWTVTSAATGETVSINDVDMNRMSLPDAGAYDGRSDSADGRTCWPLARRLRLQTYPLNGGSSKA